MAFFPKLGHLFREIRNARHRRLQGVSEPPHRMSHTRSVWIADSAQLDLLIERTGYSPLAPDIRAKARPCLYAFEAGSADDAAIGATRFGGDPDLPSETKWPRARDGRRLNFHAQIDLGDFAGTEIACSFPKSGLLSFFAGDIDPEEGNAIPVSVLHSPADASLFRLVPGSDVERYRPVRARFEPGLSFPAFDFAWLEALELFDGDCDLDALQSGLDPPFPRLGQVLGHASWPQEDLREQVYFQTIGRAGQENLHSWRSWEGWEKAKEIENKLRGGAIHRPWSAEDDENVRWQLDHAEEIAVAVESWWSLLTIESNEAMTLWINDANAIYFFAPEAGVLNGDFAMAQAVTAQS